MAIRCKDLLELPSLQKMIPVAGREGLDRVVRWVHVADVPQVSDWVQGGELLFITGIGIKKGTTSLIDLVAAVQKKKLAGLVINIGPYIQEISQEVIAFADSCGFPVFEIPWEVKLVEVTADICRAIIVNQMEEKSLWDLAENILFGSTENQQILVDRAAYHGYDLSKPLLVAIIDIDDFEGYLKHSNIQDEKKVLELKMLFQQTIQGVLVKYKKKALSVLRSDSAILLLPDIHEGDERLLKTLTDEIKQTVAAKLPGLTVSIGLGSRSTQLSTVKISLKEAEQALAVAKASKLKNNTISYKELGFYKLLFEIGDKTKLSGFFQEILGSLLDYDNNYRAELLPTLEVFLMENGNSTRTTERLYIHRNTLKYRLQKIEDLTGRNLDDSRTRLDMQLALSIGRIQNIWTK